MKVTGCHLEFVQMKICIPISSLNWAWQACASVQRGDWVASLSLHVLSFTYSCCLPPLPLDYEQLAPLSEVLLFNLPVASGVLTKLLAAAVVYRKVFVFFKVTDDACSFDHQELPVCSWVSRLILFFDRLAVMKCALMVGWLTVTGVEQTVR